MISIQWIFGGSSWVKWVFLPVVSLTVVMAGLSWLDLASAEKLEISREQIPYVRLSNEDEFPYLWHGMKPSEPRGKAVDPNKKEHLRAIEMFPSVTDCLLPEEASKTIPDIGQIDWNKMPNIEAVEVCIFRIASSIRSIKGVKKWFLDQDFSISNETEESESLMRLIGQDTGPGYRFSAGRRISNGGVFWGGWFQKHIYYPVMLARSISITVTFSSAEEVVSITTYYSHAFSK